MRTSTTLLLSLACLLLVSNARAQQKTAAAAALEQRYGPNYEEVLAKHSDDPVRLQQAATDFAAGRLQVMARDVEQSRFSVEDDDVAREEVEPNNFFNTADDINDVLALPGPQPNSLGSLIGATFSTAGDVDVYRFTVDTTRMYHFASTHSFTSDGEDDLDVNMRLFHESDLDTTFVTDFGGVEGNEKMLGDILGRDTDGRNGSGDFRLTGWVSPIDPATNRKLTGDFYLFVFNADQATGTYHVISYSVPLEPLASKAEPNQTFEEALLNPASILPTDAVVRRFMIFNKDTVKIVVGGPPPQGNSVYPQLWAQGDEDHDVFRIDGKAGHTLVVETIPYYDWYRDNDGSIGPGGSRLEDVVMRLLNADYTQELAYEDDSGREQMDGPNNIHARIVYDVTEDGPLWLDMQAWASHSRDPGQSVDNRDPGRFPYKIYAYQYTNDPVEVEPNNTVEEATLIAARTDTVMNGSFSGGADVDMYRVYLHEVRMYSIFTANSAVTSDIQVEIYREDELEDGTLQLTGNLLTESVAGNQGSNDFLVAGFVPEETGAHIIKVTSASAGAYHLGVVDKGEIYDGRIANEPDDEETDALAQDALEVGPGSQPRSGMIYPAGDVDLYHFNVGAGTELSLTLANTNADLVEDFAVEMSLIGPDGSVIETSPTNISHTTTAAGQYLVQVQAQNEGDVGFYGLSGGELIREAEPNDTPANAMALQQGFIAAEMAAGDVDYYRVTAQEGRIYHIRSDNNEVGGAMEVDLFLASDPNASIWDSSDWAGRYGDNNFKMQLLPAEDTEYLIKLTASAGAGNYEIHIKSNDISELKGTFEPNDSFAEADAIGAVTPDGTVRESMLFNPDSLEFRNDADIYAVNITEVGDTLICETLPYDGPFWGRDSDMYIELYDASGTLLDENDDNAVALEDGTIFDDWHSKVEYIVPTAGTYYCLIRSQDYLEHTDRDPTTAEYKFRITYTGATGTDINNEELPLQYALEQNYPNPFNPTTTIGYSIPKPSQVRLTVYNLLGQAVATVVDEHQAAGVYSVQFDAARLASGLYVYRLEANSFSTLRTMVLIK